MNLHRIGLYVKLVLMVITLAIGLYHYLAQKKKTNSYRKAITLILVLAALISVSTWFRFGEMVVGHFNHYHDIAHYYFPIKYSEELGYFDFYKCVVKAEAEDGMASEKMRKHKFRVVEDYSWKRAGEVINNPEACKDNFSPERWRQFKQDLKTFSEVQNGIPMYKFCVDMGYNGSPVWGILGKPIASLIPPTRWGLIGIGLLDILLIVLAFIMVYRAFGLDISLISFIVFLCIYPTHRMFVHGSFLRFDWIVYIIIGISLLKLERYKTSAFFLAYAALLRMIPVLFVFGLVFKAFYGILHNGKLERRYLHFALSYAATSLLLIGISLAIFGPNYLMEFTEKIGVHSQSLSGTRVGLPYVLMYEGENNFKDLKKIVGRSNWNQIVEHKKSVLKDRRILHILILALFLTAMAKASITKRDYEAVAMSYPLIFLLLGPTIYYSVVLAAYALLFIPRLHRKEYLINFALFIAGMIGCYLSFVIVRSDLFRHYWMSGIIFIMLGLHLGVMLHFDGTYKFIYNSLSKKLSSR